MNFSDISKLYNHQSVYSVFHSVCSVPSLAGPSHADFNIYHMLSNAQLAEPHCVSGPLENFMREIEALPRVKEFLDSRPSLVDIGQDPALLDTAGKRISQKDPPGLAYLSSSGLFSADPPA